MIEPLVEIIEFEQDMVFDQNIYFGQNIELEQNFEVIVVQTNTFLKMYSNFIFVVSGQKIFIQT